MISIVKSETTLYYNESSIAFFILNISINVNIIHVLLCMNGRRDEEEGSPVVRYENLKIRSKS